MNKGRISERLIRNASCLGSENGRVKAQCRNIQARVAFYSKQSCDVRYTPHTANSHHGKRKSKQKDKKKREFARSLPFHALKRADVRSQHRFGGADGVR